METSGNKDRAGPSSAEIRGVEQSSTFLGKQDRAELSSAPETTKETSIQNIDEGTLTDNNRVLKVPFVAHCDTSILEKSTLQDISCNVENISVETICCMIFVICYLFFFCYLFACFYKIPYESLMQSSV